MDSITQAVLGAAIGRACLGKVKGNKAALTGAIIATIPDLDVLLYLIYSPFEMLSIHRGYSHALIVLSFLSFLVAYLLSRLRIFKNESFSRLLFFSWLTLVTHALLDAFTAYGTQLFLPFSNERFGFDSINVVDPVYTLPMLLGLGMSIGWFGKKWKTAKWNYFGLVISTVYLLSTLGVKQHIEQRFKTYCRQEKILPKEMLTMPVGIGNLRWYGVAKTQDSIFLKPIHLFNPEEGSLNGFRINETLLEKLSPEQRQVMKWFSKGFYTVRELDGSLKVYNLQVDMRGVVKTENVYAPTAGYFEFIPDGNGSYSFGSGAHPSKSK
ncbi:MAG: metal-dependent hydrolase [Saprospiraceae bacterium]